MEPDLSLCKTADVNTLFVIVILSKFIIRELSLVRQSIKPMDHVLFQEALWREYLDKCEVLDEVL